MISSPKGIINDVLFCKQHQRRHFQVLRTIAQQLRSLGQLRRTQGVRHSWHFQVPEIYGVRCTVTRGRKPRMIGGVRGMTSSKIFEFFYRETVFNCMIIADQLYISAISMEMLRTKRSRCGACRTLFCIESFIVKCINMLQVKEFIKN